MKIIVTTMLYYKLSQDGAISVNDLSSKLFIPMLTLVNVIGIRLWRAVCCVSCEFHRQRYY